MDEPYLTVEQINSLQITEEVMATAELALNTVKKMFELREELLDFKDIDSFRRMITITLASRDIVYAHKEARTATIN